jgi:hypothetical protein
MRRRHMAAMDEIVQAYRPVLRLLIRAKIRGQKTEWKRLCRAAPGFGVA